MIKQNPYIYISKLKFLVWPTINQQKNVLKSIKEID